MEQDQEIVTLGTVNGWAFKLAIWFAPIFAVWMVAKVLAHDTTLPGWSAFVANRQAYFSLP